MAERKSTVIYSFTITQRSSYHEELRATGGRYSKLLDTNMKSSSSNWILTIC